MVLRRAKRGANAGKEFWGCSQWPKCRGMREFGRSQCVWLPAQGTVVPRFDSAAVLDYVLRTPVVAGDTVLEDGIPAQKMFPELLSRLRGIRSPKIHQLPRHSLRKLASRA